MMMMMMMMMRRLDDSYELAAALAVWEGGDASIAFIASITIIAIVTAIAIIATIAIILSCLVEGFLQSSTHLVAHQLGENLGAFPVSRCLEGWPETPS